MKKIIFKFLMIGLTFFYTNAQTETDYSVPVTFSVTSTGVNRFISSQWSDLTTSWTGTYQGLDYSMQLSKPYISLVPNAIIISMGVSIQAPPIYSGSITITPTLSIPSTTVSADVIFGEYTNLRQRIDEIAELIDSRLKDIIDQHLSPIDWIIYKGKVLSVTTERIVESADLKWKGLPTLSFEVNSGEINITLTPTIQAAFPTYSFQFKRPFFGTFYFKIISNDKFTFDGSNPKWTLSLGSTIAFNTLTQLPVESTYDANTGKYFTEVIFEASDANQLSNQMTLYTRIKTKRGSLEALWVLDFITFGIQQEYTSNDTNISALWGE